MKLWTYSALFVLTVVFLEGCIASPPGAPTVRPPLGAHRASETPNAFAIAEGVCPEHEASALEAERRLGSSDFDAFLTAHQVQFTRAILRPDLVLYRLQAEDGAVDLRLGILESNLVAAEALHQSLLEHGPGSFGFLRANLAILGRSRSLSEVVSLGVSTRLACFGVIMSTQLDDVYVVPGPYFEW